MRRIRFSIGSLLGVILFVGCAFGALRASSDVADSIVFGLTLGLVLLATLLAIHRREDRRAYWLGFVLFGGVYFVVSLVPSLEARLPSTMGLQLVDSNIPGRQRTFTALVDFAAFQPGTTFPAGWTAAPGAVALQPANPTPGAPGVVTPQPAYPLNAVSGSVTSQTAPNVSWTYDLSFPVLSQWQNTNVGRWITSSSGTSENFVRIGHSLFACVLGFVGGILSRRLFRTSRVSAQTVVPADPDERTEATA